MSLSGSNDQQKWMKTYFNNKKILHRVEENTKKKLNIGIPRHTSLKVFCSKLTQNWIRKKKRRRCQNEIHNNQVERIGRMDKHQAFELYCGCTTTNEWLNVWRTRCSRRYSSQSRYSNNISTHTHTSPRRSFTWPHLAFVSSQDWYFSRKICVFFFILIL